MEMSDRINIVMGLEEKIRECQKLIDDAWYVDTKIFWTKRREEYEHTLERFQKGK